jgi:tetratricopeptide (TPR) repeat protein
MNEHPAPVDLDRLLAGQLYGAPRRRVVAHLLQGCVLCRRTLAAALAGASPADYDAAIDGALARVLPRLPELTRSKEVQLRERLRSGPLLSAEEAARLPGRPLVEFLLEESRALRHRDPARMVELADMARLIADREELDDPRQTADLRARTWAELANAYRVGDDFHHAAEALETAVAWAERGTTDPLLCARLGDLAASLFSDQGRFREAERVLSLVHAIYLEHGERHLAGRALISRGLYIGYDNRPLEAIALIEKGEALVDFDREPVLQVLVVHNVAWFLVEAGRYREARIHLWKGLHLYQAAGDRLNLLRMQWLQGRIAAGLGNQEDAEKIFLVVRKGFKRAGQEMASALVALDLMVLWVEQGRRAEVDQVAGELLLVFRSLGIGREVLAVFLMFQEMARRSYVPDFFLLDEIKSLRRLLLELDRDPRRRRRA